MSQKLLISPQSTARDTSIKFQQHESVSQLVRPDNAKIEMTTKKRTLIFLLTVLVVLVLILGSCIPKPKCSGVLVAFPGDRGSLPHNRALLGPEQGQKVIY